MLKQMLKLFKRVLIQHNLVKNPSWQEVDTERDLNPESPDYKFHALITQPRCPSASDIWGKLLISQNCVKIVFTWQDVLN